MWKYKTKSINGDEFEVTCLDPSGYLCPICANTMRGEPPWHRGGFDHNGNFDASRDTLDIPQASYSICDICHVEYGVHDCVWDYSGRTQMEVWRTLRERWLATPDIDDGAARHAREVFGE